MNTNPVPRDECLQMVRVKNDVNGNPRHVVHWLGLEPATPDGLDISARYDRVIRAARAVGGKQHVDKVDPYTIGITWPSKPPKSDLYLELKGSVRAIYSGKLRAVTTAEFLGCLDGADYDFIANQVLHRLPRKNK